MPSAPFFSPLDLLVLDQLLAPVDSVNSKEFLCMDVLSLDDDVVMTDTKPSTKHCVLSMSVTVTSTAPRPPPSLPPRRVSGPQRPPVTQRLDIQRIRTKEQRRTEYKARAASAELHTASRVKCLDRERRLRLRIQQVLHALAAALGRPIDFGLMAFVPPPLRAIMERADAVQDVFRSLTGQQLLRQSINNLPSWW